MTERQLWVVDLGRMPYGEALGLQRAVARGRISGGLPEDLLLLVEHDPVVTMGRSAKEKNLIASPELLLARGVELFEVERGGDVTYHGPGQLVGYPIFDLRGHKQDLHWYLRHLEATLIEALQAIGIQATVREGLTGVWVGNRKIASIGVHARDWVTWHGFALNVKTELSYFDLIVPCGIPDVEMTSVARELGESRGAGAPAGEWDACIAAVTGAFARMFSLQPVATEAEVLRARLEDAAA